MGRSVTGTIAFRTVFARFLGGDGGGEERTEEAGEKALLEAGGHIARTMDIRRRGSMYRHNSKRNPKRSSISPIP